MVTAARFFARTEQTDGGCLIWTGAVSDAGYGQCWDGKRVVAHRLALRLRGVEIPDGHHAHHLCGVTTCVNPDHLAVVDGRKHVADHARRETCANGHPWTGETIYRRPNSSGRNCRICRADYMREYHARREADAA